MRGAPGGAPLTMLSEIKIALGIVLLFMIPVLVVLAVCVAIAFFRPKESRTGCLLVSGGLFLVCALTVAMFLVEWNTT
ncbi:MULTISPECIES: hypothetical protein [unclassified Streptomyces]|uniref:hypothetical protein n=1 Tax=unclassified Streptomyces TaxID=2593676 RepID=UPI0004BEBDF5|nr:hypothetical protein [Streptomyces sp. NRRL S-241]